MEQFGEMRHSKDVILGHVKFEISIEHTVGDVEYSLGIYLWNSIF